MLPSRATSTAVTAAHLAVPGGSCPQSRVVRYGCGRSLRGAAVFDCPAAIAPRPETTSLKRNSVDFMRESLALTRGAGVGKECFDVSAVREGVGGSELNQFA